MKKFLLILPFYSLLTIHYSSSQNLSAYLNVRNEFRMFEDSVTSQLDYLPPLDYKIGGNAIAYTDNRGDFKIYQYGAVQKPIDGTVQAYGVSDDLVYIRTPGSGYVWDQGRFVLLTRFVGDYVLCDSMIGFIDYGTRDFYFYYDGRIFLGEQGITTQPAATFLSWGANTIAYMSFDRHFKIVWRDSVYDQNTDYPQQIMAGADMVAYLDQHDTGLRIFYCGETKVVEPFSPIQYEVGNDLAAYVTYDNKFKIFYKGNLYEIGNYVPAFFKIKDNVIVYSDRVRNSFVFWKGKSYPLDNYVPDNIVMSQNTVMYYDQSNRLKIFSFGKMYTMDIETYITTSLDFDVVRMELQGKRFKFFAGGQVYTLP